MSYLSDLLGNAYKAGMTEEEISEAVKKVMEDEGKKYANLKDLLSKANSEASGYKKKLRELEPDAAKAQELEEANKRLSEVEKENGELKRSIAISSRTATLLSQGYSKELAESTATALTDGDVDTVLGNQQKYAVLVEQRVKEGLLKDTPYPVSGGAAGQPVDYPSMIEQALQDGRCAEAAYYTRLQEEASARK